MAENKTVPQKEPSGQSGPESTRGGIMFTPRVDIFETEQELTLYADVPGARSEDVDLSYERGARLITGPWHAGQPRLPSAEWPSTQAASAEAPAPGAEKQAG